MAEYATLAFGFDLKPEISTVSLDEFNKQMTIAMGGLTNKITRSTKKLEGGNWSILSHSTAITGNRLLVTVILYR
jgi:hypothetical protein